MRIIRFVLTTLLPAPLAVPHAAGTTCYVATDGNDSSEGKSLKSPASKSRMRP